MVDGEDDLDVLGGSGGKQLLRGVDEIVLDEGFADRVALRLEEGIGHAAADDEGGSVLEEAFEHGDLGGNLRAADDCGHGFRGIGHHGFEVLYFFFHEETADLDGHELGNGGGRGMGAVRGAEGVVDEHVAVCGQFLCKGFLTGFVLRGLFLVEAGVFEHQDAAGRKGVDFGFLAEAGIGEFNRFGDFFGEIFGDGLHAVFSGDIFIHIEGFSVFFGLFLGFFRIFRRIAEVAHQNEGFGTLFQDIGDGGDGGEDPRIVLDHAVFHRHIEIDAHDDAFAFEGNIFNCLDHGIIPPGKWDTFDLQDSIYKNIAIKRHYVNRRRIRPFMHGFSGTSSCSWPTAPRRKPPSRSAKSLWYSRRPKRGRECSS